MLKRPTLVLLGDFSEERRVIDPVAGQFECRIECAPDVGRAVELCGSLQASALLVRAGQHGIRPESLRASIEWHQVPIVACFGFHDAPSESELELCYHILRLPLDHVEFRQCLGFLSQAAGVRYTSGHGALREP